MHKKINRKGEKMKFIITTIFLMVFTSCESGNSNKSNSDSNSKVMRLYKDGDIISNLTRLQYSPSSKYVGKSNGHWDGVLLGQNNQGSATFTVKNNGSAELVLRGEFSATHNGKIRGNKFITDKDQNCPIVDQGNGFKIVLIWTGVNVDVLFSNTPSISFLNTFKKSTSYALGADLGENLKRQNVEIDYDMYSAGLMDALETGTVELDQNQRREMMVALQTHIRDKAKDAGNSNLKAADDFLLTNKKDNSDIKETPTGLQYRVLHEGDGESPGETDRVKVHYAGRLINGDEFDSSIKRGEPSSFGLNQVIKGWTEGLQLMKVGSKFEFFIHPKIGYATRVKPNIPSNSLLIFEVELLEIVNKK